MNLPFDKLVEDVLRDITADPTTKIGEIAERHNVSVARIVDALDTIKMLAGQATYVDEDGTPLGRRFCADSGVELR